MKCLLCYKPLSEYESESHLTCIKSVFGSASIPKIEIDETELKNYAKIIVDENTGLTGVQPKLSLWLEENRSGIRFTIVGFKSNYIIKPQSEMYANLPENEDLCMHLAKVFGIETAVHALVRLPSGKLAYITKRFDRINEQKLACEDMCQLTESPTEYKYRGSYEKIGKTIKQFSTQAGLDALRLFELVVFSFITGNADMHLKNFAMLEKSGNQFVLSPAYDLVSTALVIKNEPEQMSLTLNGRKNKLSKTDFDNLASNLLLTNKQRDNSYSQFTSKAQEAYWWIENSFLPNAQKETLQNLIISRIQLLNS